MTDIYQDLSPSNDFDNICRTCLSKGDLIPLYTDCDIRKDCIVDMLISCTFVQFSEDDGLPEQICSQCLKEVNNAYNFAKKCEISDAILRKCIEKCKTLKNFKSEQETFQTKNVVKENKQKEAIITETNDKNSVILEVYNDFNSPENYVCDNDKESENETFQPTQEINIENIQTETKSCFSCKKCNLDFETFHELKEHRIKHTVKKRKIKNYNCKKCSVTCQTYNELLEHRSKLSHKNKKYYKIQCEICSKFVTSKNMKEHLITHSEETFPCELCSAKYSLKCNLKRHINSRHGIDKPYICEICGKGYTRLRALRNHQEIHLANENGERIKCIKRRPPTKRDPNEPRNHKCQHCERSFALKSGLHQHLRIHEKKYLCNYCGKCKSTQAALDSHLTTHTGARPYPCTFCDRAFAQKSALNSHTYLHTGHRPYVCKICNKGFTQSHHLKNHLLQHSGDKPFVCSLCPKKFTTNYGLTIHFRTHTGETPYACPKCDKRFHDASARRKHEIKHCMNDDGIKM